MPGLQDYIDRVGVVEANKLAARDGLSFIKNNPLTFLQLTLTRASIYFSFARPTGFWFHLHGVSRAITLILSALYAAALFTLAGVGLWHITHLPRDQKEKALLLTAMFIMMPLAIVGLVVETRYRFLVYPFAAIFAGYAVSLFKERAARWVPSLAIAAVLLANTAFDAWRNFGRIISRIGEL